MEKLLNDLYMAVIYQNRWQVYLEGLGNTLLITACALLIGILIGLVVALVRITCAPRKNFLQKLGSWVCGLYTTVIRGTPVIVQLLILYTVILASSEGIVVCIVGFGINSGAYLAEVARSGIASVDPGQMEAGRSLGLGYGVTMRKIVLPQAVRYVIPSLIAQLVVVVKDTTVAYVVSYPDLMQNARVLITSYDALVSLYLVIAVIYILINYAINKASVAVANRTGVKIVR